MVIIIFAIFTGFWIALYETLTTKFKTSTLYNLLKDTKYITWFYRDGKGGENAIWLNKYKNDDPKQGEKFRGSSRYFVFLVDAWHFSKAMVGLGLMVIVFLYGKYDLTQNWHTFDNLNINYFLDVMIIFNIIIQSFNLFFSWVFPTKKPKLDRFEK